MLRKASESAITFNGRVLDIVALEPQASGSEVFSRAIVVTNISSDTSEDVVTLFFENQRRSGGGHIDDLIMQEQGTKAVITFKDING